MQSHGNEEYKYTVNDAKTMQFLDTIPAMPLDISLAAYYIKTTNISLDEYSKYLNQINEDFHKVQESILHEVGDYTKTRYSIIKVSLENLIDQDTDFLDLMFSICMLDSKNIPKAILNKYKKTTVVDDFIYNLKKYSIITGQSSSILGTVFSVHRSTQTLALHYLIQKLNTTQKQELLVRTANVLDKYVAELTEEEDILQFRLLLKHCAAFLSHKDLLNDEARGLVLAQLGIMSYYLSCDYLQTQKILEESLDYLHKTHDKNCLITTKTITYLGNIYRRLADYTNAKRTLEKSVLQCKTNIESQPCIVRALNYFGMVYRDLGDYAKAESTIQQSMTEANKYLRHDRQEGGPDITWTFLMDLGVVYREAGRYQEAKELLEDGFAKRKQYYAEDHPNVSWAGVQLGIFYRKLGEYDKAKLLLEKCLVNYKKYYPNDHPHILWITVQLGALHRQIGDYIKAKALLTQALQSYAKYYPNDHPRQSWNKTHLAIVLMKLGDHLEAKQLLTESLINYRKYYSDDHPSIIWVSRYIDILKNNT